MGAIVTQECVSLFPNNGFRCYPTVDIQNLNEYIDTMTHTTVACYPPFLKKVK
jgi:hypothetical protein